MVKYSPDAMFEALGNPIRSRIAERLAREGRMSVSDLASPFTMSLPGALKHIRILEATGIVVSSKKGRVRYCALNAEALAEGLSWFKRMERIWEDRFDRLAEALSKSK